MVFIGLTATRRDRVTIFEGVIGDILNPIQKYLYMGGQRISNMFSFIGNVSTLKDENDALKAENIELNNKLIDYESLKAQNERLREMLNFKSENDQYSYLGADVIGKGSGNWYDVFIINKGYNQGVREYNPVVTGRGLVGQVMSVGPNWAKVVSIIDETSKVSGIISRTRDQGMVQGSPSYTSDMNLRMIYLPAEADVKIGDVVVTSGIGKTFPKNLKIGVVTELGDENTEFVKSVEVKPEVDFTKLEEVFVVINEISEDDYPVEEEN